MPRTHDPNWQPWICSGAAKHIHIIWSLEPCFATLLALIWKLDPSSLHYVMIHLKTIMKRGLAHRLSRLSCLAGHTPHLPLDCSNFCLKWTVECHLFCLLECVLLLVINLSYLYLGNLIHNQLQPSFLGRWLQWPEVVPLNLVRRKLAVREVPPALHHALSDAPILRPPEAGDREAEGLLA